MQERGAVPAVGPAAARSRRLLLAAAVAAAVVALDQWTKSLAVDRLADGAVHLFWTLRLNLSFNSGAAFGLGRGAGPVLIVVVIVIVVLLLGLGRLAASRTLAAVALGLLIGGALGNVVDRLFRDNGGAVIDFIDFQWWPIFNVADIAITFGAGLFVLASRKEGAGP